MFLKISLAYCNSHFKTIGSHDHIVKFERSSSHQRIFGDSREKQDRAATVSFFTEAERKVVAVQQVSVDSPVRDPGPHLQARELQLDLLCCVAVVVMGSAGGSVIT